MNGKDFFELRLPLFLVFSLNVCLNISSQAQTIADPCFNSVKNPGFYLSSDDLKNLCVCNYPHLASDLIEWNGIKWEGTAPNSKVTIAPPEGCHTRAMWMSRWTEGGEGFAMRLSQPLESGKSYSFTFTYASDGIGSYGNFSPHVYTNSDGKLSGAKQLGRLPPASDWRTETISFTADVSQTSHNWLILYINDDAGMILSNCIPDDPITVEDIILEQDTAICAGTTIKLDLPEGNYTYEWNTGETTRSIVVRDSGEYSARLHYYNCYKSDSVKINLLDCEVRLTMPNFFSPNYYDDLNPRFVPMDFNQVISGEVKIYNRWGGLIFNGNLFTGWDGKSGGTEYPTGVYYYEIMYLDTYGETYRKKGTVTLAR